MLILVAEVALFPSSVMLSLRFLEFGGKVEGSRFLFQVLELSNPAGLAAIGNFPAPEEGDAVTLPGVLDFNGAVAFEDAVVLVLAFGTGAIFEGALDLLRL